MSQLSSMPLHASVGGTQEPQPHDALHVCTPVEPHAVVHAREAPIWQSKPSSTFMSQSSSVPLHDSAGGMQAPGAQSTPQVLVPVEPHVVTQLLVLPEQHPSPSSHAPLQSSSRPLHVSAGGEHTDQLQVEPQVRMPVLPHAVMQPSVVPLQHVEAESHVPSQSLSRPSQTSGRPGATSARESSQSLAGTPPLAGQSESPAPSS
jgi:hypothetical protein